MTPDQPTAELEELFPESKTVTVAGEAITITPPTVAQMGKIGKLLKRLVDDGAAERTVELLLLSHTDEVAGLVAIATGKSEDYIGGLRGDDGLQLAIAVWEVYAPFFVRRMLPMFAELAAKVSLSVGLTSSSA